MRVHIKVLKGADCTVNVTEQDKVSHMKEMIEEKLEVPVRCQRIVHRGRPLSDEWTMKQCGIKDGTKLLLAVKKEESTTASDSNSTGGATSRLDLWDELHYFLLKHYRQSDTKLIMEEFRKSFNQSVHSLSLDDIERLATMELQKAESQH